MTVEKTRKSDKQGGRNWGYSGDWHCSFTDLFFPRYDKCRMTFVLFVRVGTNNPGKSP